MHQQTHTNTVGDFFFFFFFIKESCIKCFIELFTEERFEVHRCSKLLVA